MQLERSGNTIEQQLNHAVDLSLKKRPALKTVVQPFAAVLIKRASIIDEIKKEGALFDIKHSADRLSSGVPVATDLSFAGLKEILEKSFADLLPVLKKSFPKLDADFSAIASSFDKGEYDLCKLAQAFVQGNDLVFQSALPNDSGLAGTLGFVVNWTLSALLNAARIQWKEASGDVHWSKGYCPFCGFLPAIASLSRGQGPDSEFTTGGGGQRYLHCALCGHHWRFERIRCPGCHTNDKDHLVYFQEPGEPAERIDACRNCNRYLLCIDLRKTDPPPLLDLAAVEMVYLDILAREKGFSPMTWTPWNRIDEP